MLRNAIQPWHLILIILAFVLLFGSKKLPEMARGLGKSMRILKAETKAMKDDDEPAAGETVKTETVKTEPVKAESEIVTPTKITPGSEATKERSQAQQQ